MTDTATNAKDRKHIQYWVLLCALSLIHLTSLTNYWLVQRDDRAADWNSEQRWLLTVACISFILSFGGVLAHLFTTSFAGTYFELGTAFVILIFWCAGLPKLMDTDEITVNRNLGAPLTTMGDFSLVTSEYLAVLGNAFFSGWGSFLLAFLLFATHLPREDHPTFVHWLVFGLSSLVALASSSKQWKDNDCEELDDGDDCSLSMFGVIAGAISTILGIAMVVDHKFQYVVAPVMFILWCFVFGYLTFNEGVGVGVGPLFFSIWFCFVIALLVSTTVVYDFVKDRETTTTEEATPTTTDKNTPDAKGAGAENEEEEVEVEEGGV